MLVDQSRDLSCTVLKKKWDLLKPLKEIDEVSLK